MSDKSPLTKYARLWIALSANLTLVLLVWLFPNDQEMRGPALLSIAGHQHFVLLHFPVAILMLIPFFEIWDRHNEASLIVRRLSLLGAISIWATCVFGIFEVRFNGSEEYSDIGSHLWTGIVASFIASASWLLIFQSWRVRVSAQIFAVVAMTIAAHIGGDRVHPDLFTPNKESVKVPEPKATADRPPMSLG
jgi:4-amino-4-deoxy-L-arabinose transferase-like glycosyltransferase